MHGHFAESILDALRENGVLELYRKRLVSYGIQNVSGDPNPDEGNFVYISVKGGNKARKLQRRILRLLGRSLLIPRDLRNLWVSRSLMPAPNGRLSTDVWVVKIYSLLEDDGSLPSLAAPNQNLSFSEEASIEDLEGEGYLQECSIDRSAMEASEQGLEAGSELLSQVDIALGRISLREPFPLEVGAYTNDDKSRLVCLLVEVKGVRSESMARKLLRYLQAEIPRLNTFAVIDHKGELPPPGARYSVMVGEDLGEGIGIERN